MSRSRLTTMNSAVKTDRLITINRNCESWSQYISLISSFNISTRIEFSWGLNAALCVTNDLIINYTMRKKAWHNIYWCILEWLKTIDLSMPLNRYSRWWWFRYQRRFERCLRKPWLIHAKSSSIWCLQSLFSHSFAQDFKERSIIFLSLIENLSSCATKVAPSELIFTVSTTWSLPIRRSERILWDRISCSLVENWQHSHYRMILLNPESLLHN